MSLSFSNQYLSNTIVFSFLLVTIVNTRWQQQQQKERLLGIVDGMVTMMMTGSFSSFFKQTGLLGESSCSTLQTIRQTRSQCGFDGRDKIYSMIIEYVDSYEIT